MSAGVTRFVGPTAWSVTSKLGWRTRTSHTPGCWVLLDVDRYYTTIVDYSGAAAISIGRSVMTNRKCGRAGFSVRGNAGMCRLCGTAKGYSGSPDCLNKRSEDSGGSDSPRTTPSLGGLMMPICLGGSSGALAARSPRVGSHRLIHLRHKVSGISMIPMSADFSSRDRPLQGSRIVHGVGAAIPSCQVSDRR